VTTDEAVTVEETVTTEIEMEESVMETALMKINFEDGGELRMGSPLRFAWVTIQGCDWKPSILNSGGFVLNAGDTLNNEWIALAQWHPNPSGPYFKVFLLNAKTKEILQSPVFEGGLVALKLLSPNLVEAKLISGKTFEVRF